MKVLKGIFVFISIICIAFSIFFFASYATGNTGPITMLEAGIVKIAGKPASGSATSDSKSTVTMLTNDFGLSKKQAEKVVEMAGELGIDTSNPAEMSNLIVKNAGHEAEIRELAAAVQAGQISESQATAQLASILDE